MQSSKKLVLIVDDNAEFGESTAWMLEGAGYEAKAIADAKSALSTFTEIGRDEPCCVLLDVRMPGMSGLDVHDAMREQSIDLPVVYMTGHGDVPLAVEAMKKGAITFLEKPLQDEPLQLALDAAFSPEVQQARGKSLDKDATSQFKLSLASLTNREMQIVDLVYQGFTNMNIGHELKISIKTVELHRSKATKKLNVKNHTDLIKMMAACR